MSLIDFLKLPETKNVENLDAPDTTVLHKNIIESKPFLKKLYIEFYRRLLDQCPAITPDSRVLELGSGGGFIKDIFPQAITSEILDIKDVDLQFSATDMSFKDNSLDAILMIDVLHHIPDCEAFFYEAERCLKEGGKMVMIEPANTLFSRFIYKNFHHEAFEPEAAWRFDSSGPLSSANGALPWIVFFRDLEKFKQKYPNLRVLLRRHHTPLRYLLSGGLSLRQLVPSFTFSLFGILEFLLTPLNGLAGMFLLIEIEKQKD